MSEKIPEIILAIGQSADPGKCGSCHFFDRCGDSEFDRGGACRFRMPPTRVYVRAQWDAEGAPLDEVKDSDACDFWKSSGRVFIVSRRVKP